MTATPLHKINMMRMITANYKLLHKIIMTHMMTAMLLHKSYTMHIMTATP